MDKILEGFGVSSKSVERIKLGRGVVGKTTHVVIAVMVVLAIVAGRVAANLLLYVAAIAAVVFVIYLRSILNFAQKNPAASLLEGAELLQWQQTELAAKGTGPMPAFPATPNPKRAELPPSSNGPV